MGNTSEIRVFVHNRVKLVYFLGRLNFLFRIFGNAASFIVMTGRQLFRRDFDREAA
jgi:hypothetical protein